MGDTDIGPLYDSALSEYYTYVGIARGDNLVGSQAISPKKVAAARRDWVEAEAALRDAGGTHEAVQAMLRDRVAAGSPIRRKVA